MNRVLITILKYVVAYFAIHAFLKSLQDGVLNISPKKDIKREIIPNHFPANIPKGFIKGPLIPTEAITKRYGNVP